MKRRDNTSAKGTCQDTKGKEPENGEIKAKRGRSAVFRPFRPCFECFPGDFPLPTVISGSKIESENRGERARKMKKTETMRYQMALQNYSVISEY